MLTEGSPHWTGRENLHTIYSYGHPLGVTCECGHRALVPLRWLGQLRGNMAYVKSLRLVCRACGSRRWRATLFVRQHEVEAFGPREPGAAEPPQAIPPW